jgi:PhnB protein
MSLRLTPYFMMSGNAMEAIQFYEKSLDAKVLSIQTYGDMPISFPPALKEYVAHAIVKVGETNIMFSDSPGQPIQIGDNLTICITTNDIEQSNQIFEALKQDGKVIAPLEETPFSPAFGTVKDKFGVTFTVITEIQN